MLINNKNDDGEHIYLDEEPTRACILYSKNSYTLPILSAL